MIALPSTPSTLESARHAERRILIHGVPWGTYLVMRDSLDEQRTAVRLTYLEGTLEIMSPSQDHEDSTKLLARLVEAYAEEVGLDLDGHRSTTYRSEAARRGLEADECYTLGRAKRIPDLAIEVVFSSPLLDKLAVYEGLGVPEVWIYSDGALTVHVLGSRGYQVKARSKLLPHLDVDLLTSFVRLGESQTKLVRDFRAALRGSTKRGRRGRSAKK